MTRILEGSHSFTCTPRAHPLTEGTISAFAFPAKAGTPEGWKAELALTEQDRDSGNDNQIHNNQEKTHTKLCTED